MSGISSELLIGGIILLIGCLVYLVINRFKTTNVFVSEIEAALKPYVLQGIFAGEKIARQGIEDARLKLAGTDRKEIADYFYNLLPDTLVVNVSGKEIDIPIDLVKKTITESYFETFVENVYQETDKFLKDNEDKLDQLVKDFPTTVDGQG